ncbi:MAG TPA: sugar phosphate isomerase/epimerase [Urbifossiella sp.]|nr:sugar phosphate isomerase/epimerase [Urbifossiella sp.]
MTHDLTRRAWIAGTAGGAALAAQTQPAAAQPVAQPAAAPAPAAPFKFCLNTSTVRDADGRSRRIVDLIDIAAKAGYAGIEPWVSEVEAYIRGGGTAKELGKRVADAGLEVPDVIGFAEWIVEDPDRRRKGLEQARREMGVVAELGGRRMAAPPVGATGGTSKRDDPNFTQPVIDLLAAADRYRALAEVGRAAGVTPVVEVWGFSRTLKRLGEAVLVAAESGAAGGCVLPDTYHLYKGGSDIAGLNLLSAAAIGIFHANDYPRVDRERITDADRVYPGDGVGPVRETFARLRAMGYTGYVSLELFNRDYWRQDPHRVAATGLAKMKAAAGA